MRNSFSKSEIAFAIGSNGNLECEFRGCGEKPAIRKLHSAIESTGPDADNELDDSQVVLLLRRFNELRCKQFGETFRGFSCCINNNRSTRNPS
jgi:hypothetical protein